MGNSQSNGQRGGSRNHTIKLTEVLLEHVAPPVRVTLEGGKELSAMLARMLEEAHRAWPAWELDPEVFMAHVARHVTLEVGPGALNGPGLYLAAACLQGVPEAVAALDKLIDGQAAQMLRMMDATRVSRESLIEQVRQRLLEGSEGKQPRIASYSGIGSIESWLRAAILRVSFNRIRDVPRKKA